MLEILTYPFMQRALLAGLVVAALLSFLGVFVILKKAAFFSDGIAHASLTGVALGLFLGINPLFSALLFGVVLSVGLHFFKKYSRFSTDHIIGLLFTFGLALGLLLINLQTGYQPDLFSYLFGNILLIGRTDLVILLAVAFIIFLFLLFNYKKLVALTLNQDLAYLAGINIEAYQIIFNIILATAVVLGMKILGLLLVSALLLIPVSISKLVASNFKNLLYNSIIVGVIVVLFGMIFAYYLNWPVSACIVLLGLGLFFMVLAVKVLKTKSYK